MRSRAGREFGMASGKQSAVVYLEHKLGREERIKLRDNTIDSCARISVII